MILNKSIDSKVFDLISKLDTTRLLQTSQEEIRPILPNLVRMCLCNTLDSSQEWELKRERLLQLISGIDAVNEIISLLSVDFQELKDDATTEQKMINKLGENSESFLGAGLNNRGVLVEFERSVPAKRFRILLSEIMPTVMQIERNEFPKCCKESELFECITYLDIVTDVICILCSELPTLMNIHSMAETLLYFPNYETVICKLVANNPESFLPVCNRLLGISKDGTVKNPEKNNFDVNLRCNMLIALCKMNPQAVLTIRDLCVLHCQLPDLAVRLTLMQYNSSDPSFTMYKSISKLVSFASGLLLGNDAKVRSWFASYIRQAKGNTQFRDELVKQLRSVLDGALIKDGPTAMEVDNDNSTADMYLLVDENCLQAAALLRLYCALKAITGMKFTTEEAHMLFSLITCFPPLTPGGIRFVSLALSMLIACPALLADSSQESKAVSWIKWLASRSTEMELVGPKGCSFAEQLLLTAIHLHGDRQSAAIRLACASLGMRIKVSSAALAKIKQIFTEEVFPTEVIAMHTTKVPVTKHLNSTMTGYLPVHCVYQLLKNRAFSQGRVSVHNWIYKQICCSQSPLHPQLQPLIVQYVNTIVTPVSKGRLVQRTSIVNDPFTEEQVMRVYLTDNSENTLTAQVLMLYYVILYEDSILNNMQALVQLPNRPKRYSAALINKIPVKLLLYKCHQQPKACQGLYPALLGLLATHLPHLCLVEDSMQDLNTLSAARPSQVCKKISFDPEQLFDGLRRAVVNPAPALLHLRTLSHPGINADDIIAFADSLTSGLGFLLEEKISRRVHQEALKLWYKFNSVVPRKLWVSTINAIQRRSINAPSNLLSFDDLIDNPLLVLNIDARVFSCPELFSIVLRILSSCLSASKSMASTIIKAHPTLDKTNQSARSASPIGSVNLPVAETEKEELKAAYIATQNCAVIQMLLEVCLPNGGTISSGNLLTSAREVQCLVCSHLHQMFIEDPNVAKLIHFQGYQKELVAVLVAGVPSMHICLDFVPELLQQPQAGKQLFALELASQLCCQYKLPKSLSIAKLCVNVILTSVTVIPLQNRCAFFLQAITTLPNFAKTFPPLVSDCVQILLQLGRISHAYIASMHSLVSVDCLTSPDDWSGDDEFMMDLTPVAMVNSHVTLYTNTRKIFYDIAKSAAA